MRPLFCAVVILAAGCAVGALAPAGSARATAPGDGCFVVQGGYGKVTVTLTQGIVFGRYSEGTLLYGDQNGVVHLPTVPGVNPTKLGDHLWKYSDATDVRFRTAGPTKLTVNAQLINLSVVGKGTATVSGAGFDGVPFTLTPPSNAFSVDAASFCEENFQKMPLKVTKYVLSSPVKG
jgi:hypothetical protein